MDVKQFDMKTMVQDDFVSFEQAAKDMGVRYQQVYHRAERGALGTIYTAFGKKLIAKSEIAQWKVNRAEYFAKQTKK